MEGMSFFADARVKSKVGPEQLKLEQDDSVQKGKINDLNRPANPAVLRQQFLDNYHRQSSMGTTITDQIIAGYENDAFKFSKKSLEKSMRKRNTSDGTDVNTLL